MKDIDLNVDRSPSAWRRLIRTRARRLTGRRQRQDPRQYRETLVSVIAVADAALSQHDRNRHYPQERG